MNTTLSTENINRAAAAIREADALVIAAGAGMGVDSGLPDFRGDDGFWKAYPPLAMLGLTFREVANPQWFETDPELAWGFYGHRLDLYRNTAPHAGFQILHQWAQHKAAGYFIYTSNVDGHFQKAGFDASKIVEFHGSLLHLQCRLPCGNDIWSAEEASLDVDEESFRAEPPLPFCPHCSGVARPNVLMFNDGQWIWDRTRTQEHDYGAWLSTLADKELVVIEIGAGTAVPSVRYNSENLQSNGATLVRINPREAQGSFGTISISSGALEALEAIQAAMGK